jgi:predicted NBD/HSP70 family sugar kinase
MYIVFDIGGTKTRVAISRDGKKIDEIKKFATPKGAEEGMAEIARAARELLGGGELVGIAGGIRGPLAPDRGSIIHDAVLSGWSGVPVRVTLEKIFSTPVLLENDAALAGLGEAHYGAGKGHDIVAYHTVSTGVGGVRIVRGMIDIAHTGFEPGTQIIDLDYTKTGGENDTLEELISGSALERRAGKKPYEISQDDPIWDELAKYLAVGLRNTVAYWSPDVIVLGGSMVVGDPRIMLAPIRLHLGSLLRDSMVPCPPIFDAALKDDAGIYGALVLLRQRGKH